jgi:ubiquinol-cytochrome c reductase cytochrome c1 subunit
MWRRMLRPAAALAATTSAGVAGARRVAVGAADDEVLHPPHIQWPHSGMLSSFDAAAIRRGYHVYTSVCASCHSMNRIAYRNLVDVAFTEDEVKAICEDIEVEDGPNEEGVMFSRPGRLADTLPAPYPNEEAARYANNGALPPDLSLIVKARHGGENYLWALLTGYRDPPEGINIREGVSIRSNSR